MKSVRNPTDKEQLIEAQYKLKQWQILLQLIGKEIGQDKIIEIAKSSDYPKNDDQIKVMIEQGKALKDLERYRMFTDDDIGLNHAEREDGEWVKWSDIEKIIK